MSLIQNLILTNLFIILIYGVYKAGFSKSSSFMANRIFLVAGLAAALILPWISPVMNFLVPVNEIQWLPSAPVALEEPLNQAEPMVMTSLVHTNPADLALWIYFSMAGLLLLFSVILWIRLILMTRKAPVHRYNRLKIVVIDKGWTAFSIFRTVFYPKPFVPDRPETKLILEHELVHARQLHTVDNIFYGAVRLLFFINPFIHLLHKELMITHEYLADRLTSTADRTGYSQILVSHQFKVPHFILMHPFNKQSFLKRRLDMLSKNTTNHLAGWKYLLLLPLLAGMILGSSWSATAQDKNQKIKAETAAKVEKQLKRMGFVKTGEKTWSKDGITVMAMDDVTMDEIKAKLKEAEEAKIRNKSEEAKQVFLIVEEMPTFQGGTIEGFRNWVQSNVKYPPDAKVGGTVYVSFMVNKKGEVEDINIIRSASPILDAEVVKTLQSAPAWSPGKQRGQEVNVAFSIPIKFIINGKAGNPDKVTKEDLGIPVKPPVTEESEMEREDSQVFMIVEEMPTFQGGELEDFRNWVQAHLEYPAIALENKIQGTVYVSFVVNSKGKIVMPNIVRKVDPVLDEEAFRLLKSAPDWTPGRQQGKPVNVSFSLPVAFVLDGKRADPSLNDKTIEDDADKMLFLVCEEMPEFEGGNLDHFRNWAQANVKYPYKAMEESISGTVEVSFVVNKEGKVIDVSITKSADPVLDEAALNVVRSSPTWKPGKQRSRLVNVRQTIPIKFILQ
ncbi:MAG: M56 family metallopeptidase [Bacteroidales bacterium]|jgi:TonB family protein